MQRNTASFKNMLIGKIHVARKQMALHEDSYRAILKRVTGKDSCGRMDVAELDKVLAEFKRLGFKPKGGKRAGTRKQADSAQAAMIRALWLDLYHLGAIKDPSEEALGAFVKRSCGIPALQWVDTYKADTVIKALRGWLQRVGFEPPHADIVEHTALYRAQKDVDNGELSAAAIAWKLTLIQRQMAVLGIQITQDNAPVYMAADLLDPAIEAYGRSIRTMKAGQA